MSAPDPTIDLNADLGEDPAALEDGREAALLDHITSANIACGGHAGDARTMRAVLTLALERGVAIGAHPGYADRAGFGRVPLELEPAALRHSIEQQIRALLDEADSLGATVGHVKPHGALYHAASTDPGIADAIMEAAHALDPALLLVGACDSPALKRWQSAGARVVAEGFIDRRYRKDGTLTPRTEPDALIHDDDEAIQQAIALASRCAITLPDGTRIRLHCQTLCVHSDTPGAATKARLLRAALGHAGIGIRSCQDLP